MGTVCSIGSTKTGVANDVRIERLRTKVSLSLKKIRNVERAKQTEKKVTLESIIMRFDRSRAILKLIKDMFNELAGSSGALDEEGLNRAMSKISTNMSREDVRGLFEFIDLDDSRAIELKEFLVALVIGHVLEQIPIDPSSPRAGDSSSSVAPEADVEADRSIHAKDSVLSVNTLMNRQEELKVMMTMIVNAHLLFDPEATGVIQRKNVESILQNQTGGAGAGTKAKKSNPLLSDDRWKEMDWNSDGSIDFAEFVFAFCSWVDIDDDMGDDDDA